MDICAFLPPSLTPRTPVLYDPLVLYLGLNVISFTHSDAENSQVDGLYGPDMQWSPDMISELVGRQVEIGTRTILRPSLFSDNALVNVRGLPGYNSME